MPTQVLMPQLGESVVEGTVTKWLKAIGDPVKEYEPLLEVNTDKVDTEVPSPAGGIVLEILIEPNTTVKAGTLLAIIGAAGEGAPNRAPAATASAAPLVAEPSPPPSPAAAPTAAQTALSAGRDRVLGFISPIVAKLAREHQLDLSNISGSGESGRITKKDVLAYLASPSANPPQAPETAATTPALLQFPAGLPGDELMPLSSLRRSIAEHMVYSKHTSPHVTTIMEVDMSRVVAHRSANKEAFARGGYETTFGPGSRLAPARSVDPRYADQLRQVAAVGVEPLAIRLRHTPEGIEVGEALPVDLD